MTGYPDKHMGRISSSILSSSNLTSTTSGLDIPSSSIITDDFIATSLLPEHDVIVNIGNVTDSHDTYNLFHDRIFTFEKANLFFDLAIIAITLIIFLLVAIGTYFLVISCINLFDDSDDEKMEELRLKYPKGFIVANLHAPSPNNSNSNNNNPSSIPHNQSNPSSAAPPPEYDNNPAAMSEKGFREEPLRPASPSSV